MALNLEASQDPSEQDKQLLELKGSGRDKQEEKKNQQERYCRKHVSMEALFSLIKQTEREQDTRKMPIYSGIID